MVVIDALLKNVPYRKMRKEKKIRAESHCQTSYLARGFWSLKKLYLINKTIRNDPILWQAHSSNQ